MTDREREALQLAMDATAKAAAISDLASTVDDFTEEVRGVREDIAAEKAWRRRFVVALAVMAASTVLLLAMSGGLLAVALQNRENGRVIRDTVDPGGERYERNQRAQAGVVQGLVDSIDAAVAERLDAAVDRLDCRIQVVEGVHIGECP